MTRDTAAEGRAHSCVRCLAGGAGRGPRQPSIAITTDARGRGRAAGGETLAAGDEGRGRRRVGEWLGEMRSPRFGVWWACCSLSLVFALHALGPRVLHYSTFTIARSTHNHGEKKLRSILSFKKKNLFRGRES